MKNDDKNKYDPNAIEPKWQAIWEKENVYQPDLDTANDPFYNLMMFPYPSAEGMHIGGVRTFGGVDIYGRFKRMQGRDVFQPFGLDGFGIHAENYALKIGANPMDHSEITEANFYRQIKEAGIGVDWSRTVETYKPEYYRWTQWLFVQLFKQGLAYRKKSPVNFCPSCKTVLADEQVIDAKCERCSSIVEKKNLEQWFFGITKYADRLLNNIDDLNWTEKVKTAQRNWIGKKTGIEISYPIEGLEKIVTVFTTRPDTNFGATFIALAPEHPVVQEILRVVQDDIKQGIENYIENTKKKTDIDRQSEGREKTGVFTGLYAINQLTGYKMAIWVSDFVLMGFGTGAVVGVPGHDKRDFEFAIKFGLEIKRVVVGSDGDKSEIKKIEQVQEEDGAMVNSEFLNGLDVHIATEKIMDYLEEKGFGNRKTTYHLRDWLISRQRYWGPPIPMIYCQSCADKGFSWFTNLGHSGEDEGRLQNLKGSKDNMSDSGHGQNDEWEAAGWFPVHEEQLPVKLPYIEDFKPLGTGNSPLGNHPEFYNTKCPNCGKDAERETDVSDTFLDSSWYFMRYISTEFDDKSLDQIRAKKWLPVHMYIGGAEHSVLHLLYARFITMVIHDLGMIDFEEPFARFYAHGLIIKDGAKMSKSKGNVVGPDLYIKKYGADTLRMYLHFLAPFNQEGDFRDSGIEGMNRFLKRVWTLLSGQNFSGGDIDSSAKSVMNEAIKNITEEIQNLRFNTSIAFLMSYYNYLIKQASVSRTEAETYLKMLAPFAPHMAEELYQNFILSANEGSGKDSSAKPQNDNKFKSIHVSSWPEYDEKAIIKNLIKIPVQVNGKLRGMLEVSPTEVEEQKKIQEMAESDKSVKEYLSGKTIKKFIYIPGKVVNFVI